MRLRNVGNDFMTYSIAKQLIFTSFIRGHLLSMQTTIIKGTINGIKFIFYYIYYKKV